MANLEHEAILHRGVEVWNQWREDNPDIEPDLSDGKFKGANLEGVDLEKVELFRTDFEGANLNGVNFYGANIDRANFKRAYLNNANFAEALLFEANLSYTELHNAYFGGARLGGADFSYADLSYADLDYSHLGDTNFSYANLRDASLSQTMLIQTNFENADISGCHIFGISAWRLKTENLTQKNLVITADDEPQITVDNLEIAQFVYLLLNNTKLRSVIDTLTTKSVLILGRFTEERKAVLDSIRDELRKHDYVPMLFDFEKPVNRDTTETVKTLAGLARFVIADLSDPNSIPHELMSFAESLLSVPVQGIFCPTVGDGDPYSMFGHLRRYPHVLPIFRYDTPQQLIASLEEKVIQPAEAKVIEMRPPTNPVL